MNEEGLSRSLLALLLAGGTLLLATFAFGWAFLNTWGFTFALTDSLDQRARKLIHLPNVAKVVSLEPDYGWTMHFRLSEEKSAEEWLDVVANLNPPLSSSPFATSELCRSHTYLHENWTADYNPDSKLYRFSYENHG